MELVLFTDKTINYLNLFMHITALLYIIIYIVQTKTLKFDIYNCAFVRPNFRKSGMFFHTFAYSKIVFHSHPTNLSALVLSFERKLYLNTCD